jgi:glycerol uptake facilitator-like aquaporin
MVWRKFGKGKATLSNEDSGESLLWKILSVFTAAVALCLIIIGTVFLLKDGSKQSLKNGLHRSWVCWILGGMIGSGLFLIMLISRLRSTRSKRVSADTLDSYKGKNSPSGWAVGWNWFGFLFFFHMAIAGIIALYISPFVDPFRALRCVMLSPLAIDFFVVIIILVIKCCRDRSYKDRELETPV